MTTLARKGRCLLTLWRRFFAESFALLAAGSTLVFAIGWIYVWLTSKLDLGALGVFLKAIPDLFPRHAGFSIDQLTSPAGHLSVVFIHPVVSFTGFAWAIARGSDTVSGQIDRGTMEMLLAQPVSRRMILSVQLSVIALGCFMIALMIWLGVGAGLATVKMKVRLDWLQFLPAAINFFAILFCVSGLTVLASACDRYRRRTIGIVGGFLVVQLIIRLIAVAWVHGKYVAWLTLFTAYEPQRFIGAADPWGMLNRNVLILVGIGLTSMIAAGFVFSRRDIPAPI